MMAFEPAPAPSPASGVCQGGLGTGSGGVCLASSDPPSRQTVICKLLLEEHKSLLLSLDVRDNVVVVNVPADEGSLMVPMQQRAHCMPTPVHKATRGRKFSYTPAAPENWMSISRFYETASSRITSYFEQSLDLFAKLCVGGNMRTFNVVSEFVSRSVSAGAYR